MSDGPRGRLFFTSGNRLANQRLLLGHFREADFKNVPIESFTLLVHVNGEKQRRTFETRNGCHELAYLLWYLMSFNVCSFGGRPVLFTEDDRVSIRNYFADNENKIESSEQRRARDTIFLYPLTECTIEFKVRERASGYW